MIRFAEAVLQGHPDKLSDMIADRMIEAAYQFDDEAYGQVEVSVWSDHIFLSGATVARKPFDIDVRDLVVQVGKQIGYTKDNYIDVEKYSIDDRVCKIIDDPRQWTHSVNDQAICIGWAGYDLKTHFLPPEQFLAHTFRQALIDALTQGDLKGEGPDGKLLVHIKEHASGFELEHVLCTLQQKPSTHILDLTRHVARVLHDAYLRLQGVDARWTRSWKDIEVLINPNGPLINGGSDGDNGQTGRKLVMDYYGPRVPIGGGALSGKDFSHIDRAGAYAARSAAVKAVCSGAKSCQVTLTYAPNCDVPLDVCYDMEGRGEQLAVNEFQHSAIKRLTQGFYDAGNLGSGCHFFAPELPWNAVAHAL